MSGIASAQPGPPPQPPPPPMDTTTTTPPPDPGPPENPQPPVDPNPPPPPPTPHQQVTEPEPADENRPSALSIALGIGFASPWDVQMPNISTARLRLPSGITLEPVVRITNRTEDVDNVITGEEANKVTQLTLGTLVRLPLVSHGRVDLEALGGATFSSTKVNPEGDYNATTSNSFELVYGVGLAYWISPHWQVSFTATNPLVDYRQTKMQPSMPNVTNKSSDTTIGIIADFDAIVMIHLYN